MKIVRFLGSITAFSIEICGDLNLVGWIIYTIRCFVEKCFWLVVWNVGASSVSDAGLNLSIKFEQYSFVLDTNRELQVICVIQEKCSKTLSSSEKWLSVNK
uniref:Uncharacterized protein n=1 Tax=Helianthus annuus TaxID=4232 RepID=A0A251S0H7_HELAN